MTIVDGWLSLFLTTRHKCHPSCKSAINCFVFVVAFLMLSVCHAKSAFCSCMAAQLIFLWCRRALQFFFKEIGFESLCIKMIFFGKSIDFLQVPVEFDKTFGTGSIHVRLHRSFHRTFCILKSLTEIQRHGKICP